MGEWELSKARQAPVLDDGPIKAESVNLDTYGWYFEQCDKYRSLLTDISVVVPVRPQDGINHVLARMLSIWYGEGTPWSQLNDHMGGFIECTRANIAYHFVNNYKEKYLLMIDNDMEPPINLPYLLARHDVGVVGSCAMSVDEKFGPQLCFSVESEDGKYRFPCLSSGQRIPARGLKKVGHVGTGAILVRRDVLESFDFSIACRKCDYTFKTANLFERQVFICPKCKSPEHVEEDIPFLVPQGARMAGMSTGTLSIGEDIAFCNQVRQKGYDIYVDLEAHCGHRKTMSLQWDTKFTDSALDADKWKVPAHGKIIHSL